MSDSKTIGQLTREVTEITGLDRFVIWDPEGSPKTGYATADTVAGYLGENLTGITISGVAGLQTALDGKQPVDADLTGLAGLSTTGVVSRTGSGTFTAGTVATADIANAAVSYAKIQNVSATDKILGRSTSGAGSVEEITCTSFARSYLDDSTSRAFRSTTNTQHTFQIKIIDDTTTLTTGDGKVIFVVDPTLNGLDLVAVGAALSSVSSSGTPTIQVRNITNGNVDMLSTRITIDANENTSYTAATAAVINTSNDNVATGDLISIDVDVAGTSAGGLSVILTFG